MEMASEFIIILYICVWNHANSEQSDENKSYAKSWEIPNLEKNKILVANIVRDNIPFLVAPLFKDFNVWKSLK